MLISWSLTFMSETTAVTYDIPGRLVVQARHVRRLRHGRIPIDDAKQFDSAWHFAVSMGMGPTLFISINWNLAPSLTGAHPMDRNARLRDGLKQFLYRHAPGVPWVWLEVREAPSSKGEGVHLLVHVPASLRSGFAHAVRRLVAHQSSEALPTAVDVRPVEPRWWPLRDYLLKGGDDEVKRRYRTRRFHKDAQGVIHGPRLRCSHSIGAKAQLDAGWSFGASSDVTHH